MNDSVAVLHFGGTALSIVIAARGVGGALKVKTRVNAEYGGIIGGEFVEPAVLADVLKQSVAQAFRNLKKKPRKLFVGVPPSFCEIYTKSQLLNFSKIKEINAKDIRELLDFDHSNEVRTVINKSAVYYRLDDGRPVIDALGAHAKKVQAQISLIACANSFIAAIRSCLVGSGLKRVEFVSAALAECLYLIEQDSRDKTAVMISCGMFATGVSVCSGDGLVYARTFDQGIAHVINDVSVVLDIPFVSANLLVNEAVLSVKMNADDNYEVAVGSGPETARKAKFSAATVNDIIKSRMEVMGDNIVRIINAADSKLINNPIFICGGNLDAVGGARDFFSKTIGAHIHQCVCPLTRQNKPSELTISALVNLALLQEGR